PSWCATFRCCLLTRRCWGRWWRIGVLPVLGGEGAGRTEDQLRQTRAGHHVALHCLADGVCPTCGVRGQALAFRVIRLAWMPERRRQVVRATCDTREPWYGQNPGQVVVRLLGLDLGQYDHVPVGPSGEAELATVLFVQPLRVIELRPTPTA